MVYLTLFICIFFLQPDEYPYLYRVSYAWFALIGFTVTVVLGLAASELAALVSRCESGEPDRDLFIDFIRDRMPSTKENENKAFEGMMNDGDGGGDEKEAVPLKSV